MSILMRRCAMDDDVWRPTHLTSDQMEERRLMGATLLRQGRLSRAQTAQAAGTMTSITTAVV
jgi:hypothetical protein